MSAGTMMLYEYGVPVSSPVSASGNGSPACMSCVPLAEVMFTGENAVPPPNSYSPFGFTPKIVESRFTRISVPHLKTCAPCDHEKSCFNRYRLLYDPKIDPAGWL